MVLTRDEIFVGNKINVYSVCANKGSLIPLGGIGQQMIAANNEYVPLFIYNSLYVLQQVIGHFKFNAAFGYF